MNTHWIFDKRVQIYQREQSAVWQCATRIDGDRFRASTGEENLARAISVAEEWYLDLRGQIRVREFASLSPTAPVAPKVKERTFREVAKAYMAEIGVLAISNRSPKYVEFMTLRMNRHIIPFFGDKPLSAINRGMVQTYRAQRAAETIARTKSQAIARATTDEEREAAQGQPPSRSTMLQEIVHIRQVLKYAEGNGWIPFVPSLKADFMSQGKKGRRAWFSPEEYTQLYEATRDRITKCPRPNWKPVYEDLHDYVLFMANTGLRPDEAGRLELRDVKIEFDKATRETILVIDVRGKTGVGYCKSTERAVHPFERIWERRLMTLPDSMSEEEKRKAAATMPVFPKFPRDLFKTILTEEGLRTDRDGKKRTAYSLRHTYISMRLMEGANIHQIANNCRTSVQMIEEHYASHIKDRLDTTQINVRRPGRKRQAAANRDSSPQPSKKSGTKRTAKA